MKEQKKRGRRPIGDAPMTPAERKRRQKEKMTAAGIRTVNVTLTEYTAGVLKRYSEITGVSEADQISVVASSALLEWAQYQEGHWPEIETAISELRQIRERRGRGKEG